MTTFTWRTWGGRTRTVDADRVSFEPGHVAFWRAVGAGWVLVLAVDNNDVKDLRPGDDQ